MDIRQLLNRDKLSDFAQDSQDSIEDRAVSTRRLSAANTQFVTPTTLRDRYLNRLRAQSGGVRDPSQPVAAPRV